MEDRNENIRRIGEMTKLFVDAGIIALTAFISPFRKNREYIRQLVGQKDYIEVYCRCSLDVCESRDVKGLYQKARMGEISEFTGISSPYEPPENPDLVLDTGNDSLDDCVEKVISLLHQRGVIHTTE